MLGSHANKRRKIGSDTAAPTPKTPSDFPMFYSRHSISKADQKRLEEKKRKVPFVPTKMPSLAKV